VVGPLSAYRSTLLCVAAEHDGYLGPKNASEDLRGTRDQMESYNIFMEPIFLYGT